MKKDLLTIQEAANLLGVSTKTLRRWEGRGTLIPQRTPGNQRRYTREQIEKFKQPQEQTSQAQYGDQPQTLGQEQESIDYESPLIPEPKKSIVKTMLRISRPQFMEAAQIGGAIAFLAIGLIVVAGGLSSGELVKQVGQKTGFLSFRTPAVKETGRSEVLAAKAPSFTFNVHVPSLFKAPATFEDDADFLKAVKVSGPLTVQGKNVILSEGNLTASSIVLGLTAGDGITVETGQTPKVTNSGVLSLGGSTGKLSLKAGTGISIDGLTITNSSPESNQNLWKTIALGSSSVAASSTTDTFTFAAGNAELSLALDTSNKKLTVTGNTGFTNNGTAVVLTTSTQNVGIGTATPTSFKLQLSGDVGPTTDNTYDIGSSSLTWKTLYVQNIVSGSSSGLSGVWQRNSGVLSPANISDDVTIGGIATSSALIKFAGLSGGRSFFLGNLGIGTTAPGAALSVGSTNGATIGAPYATVAAPTNGLAVYGNVGIGTTSPQANLQVVGSLVVSGSITVGSCSGCGASGTIQLSDGSFSSPSLQFTNDTDTGMYLVGTNSLALVTGGNGAQTLSLDANGNVGIGITSPIYKLQVVGRADISSTLSAASGLFGYAPTVTVPTNGLAVYGNVGIGTTSPGAALEVAGTTKLSGTVNISGRLTSSIIPLNDLSVDLGASGTRFNNLYIGSINSNSTLTTTGQAQFTYSPTSTSYTESTVLINPTTASTNVLLLGMGVGGFARAGFDAEGDLTIGYNSAVTAPVSQNPLNIYNHGGSMVFTVTTAGNLGVGTSTPGSALQVNGGGVIGFGAAPFTVSTNGLVVAGNVGIGTSNPGAQLSVAGGTNIGASYATVVAPTNGLAVQGNVGIGTTSPLYNLQVAGTANVTSTLSAASGLFGYAPTVTAPTNGLAILGNVGIGTTSPGFGLQVTGSGLFSSTLYSSNQAIGFGGSPTAPANGLAVSGNIGIGTTSPSDRFSILSADSSLSAGIFNTSYAGTAVFTGYLNVLDYSPGSTPSTSPTGDILRLNLGVNGTNFAGNFLNVLNNSSSIFSISQTQVSTSLPLNITAPGDVSIAYDIVFTNPTASFIKSQAPLQIVAGEAFNSSNLTLQTYNAGSVVVSPATGTSTSITGLLRVDGTSSTTTFASLYVNTTNTGSSTTAYGQYNAFTDTQTTANTDYGMYLTMTQSGALTSGTKNVYGIYSNPTTTGANTSTATVNVYGGYFQPSSTTSTTATVNVYGGYISNTATVTSTGTVNSYGLYIANGTSNNTGTSTKYGLFVENQSGADNNYAAVFHGGNVGIGTTAPGAQLSVAGGTNIGASYATVVAPTNGLAVQGNVGIGTTSPGFMLDVAGGGRFSCTSGFTVSGATTSCSDVAELYESSDPTLEAGDVISISTTANKVAKASQQFDARVIGVYSTSPGLLVGGDIRLGGAPQDGLPAGKVPVALIGRVPVKVSTESGTIAIGDFLTSSSTPGVAMKATRAGVTLGKALESFDGSQATNNGIGKITAFVNVGWFDPSVQIALNGNLLVPASTQPLTGTITSVTASSSANLSASNSGTLVQDPTIIDLTNRIDTLSSRFDALETTVTNASTSAFLSLTADFLKQATSAALLTGTSSATLSQDIGSLSLTTNSATISGTLNVLDRATFSDVGITGTLTAGVLTVDGLNGEINTLAGPLRLQSLALNGLDLVGGNVTIDTKGNIIAQSITTSEYKVVAGTTAGSGSIAAGTKSADIVSTFVESFSHIFVTPTSTTSAVLAVTDKIPGKRFTVSLPVQASVPISFDWWIVNEQ